jgi:hypothetical protein
MPLGDSITGAPGCWRALLWNRLQSTGYTNIDFVGTLGTQPCSMSYDGNNEGHAGFQAVGIADQNQLPGWLSATNPDIVMMHLGTNDIWGARSTSAIITAFGKLVDQMRANNPNMKIIVAKILPMTPSNCSACYQRVVDLNAAIPAWASGKSTTQSPIVVVDQWTGFNTATDTTDGVHPNSAGDKKMSDKWYPALVAFLSGSPTRTPTRTPTPVTPTPVTPTPVTPTPGTPTPTRTPTPVTPTPTPGSSTPCSPVTGTVSAPFSYDGAGTFCWQIASIPNYINSWNLTSLKINGVDFSNIYAFSTSLPPKINGYWYVSYSGQYGWSHFEAK